MPDKKDIKRTNSGYKYIGFVSNNSNNDNKMSKTVPYLGSYENLNKIEQTHNFNDPILAIANNQPTKINSIFSTLQKSISQIEFCSATTPAFNNTLQGGKVEKVPYFIYHTKELPEWQKLIKTITDYFFAILIFIIAIPIFLFIYTGIKVTSKGPVIYTQERLGKNKKPFTIYKFRTMYTDAEKDGHQLSYTNDPRITPVGKYLRKWHLDEIPQIINILKGDMALIGPRPEREFYVNQILQKAPHYEIIFNVKPGITSLGMVKFGYAQNVEEMLKRLKYDVAYMKNRSISTDCKIFLCTFKSIILGDGK